MELSCLKQDIEEWIKDYFAGKGTHNKRIYEAMEYSLTIGGKRIRPILFLLSYSLFKESYKTVLPAACAIEMIHTYSLIHDDLPCMDNDDLRRGMPTSHKVFGEGMAVLAGDALLNEAMNILFNLCLVGPTSAIKASSVISEASGAEGMIGGQVVDILSEGILAENEVLHYMHNKKTGALIKASVLAGGILGEADSASLKILEEYGDKLGLAFQIKDDILDVTGETEKLGKKVNSDVDNKKSTFITAYGLEKCKDMCISLTEDCIRLLNKIGCKTEALEELTLFLLKRDF